MFKLRLDSCYAGSASCFGNGLGNSSGNVAVECAWHEREAVWRFCFG